MPPNCLRCNSQRILNLDTARKLGIAAGAIAGSLKGAYTALYGTTRLIPSASSFPVSRLSAAVVAAATGGIAGAAAGHQIIQHFYPPGEGIPWLCLGCGHAFRSVTS